MGKGILKQIHDCLTSNGFKTYFPSQKHGECLEPYIVIKLDGTYDLLTVSSERPIYTIMVYIPENRYSIFEKIIFDVKQTLKKMYPTIMYIGNETPSYYDENVKANMVSFQYYGCRKKENF